MKDRFNFRFGVTISHYDENDEDIETTIICETEAIYDDGTVGICKDTLENVVNALKLGDEKERTLWNALCEYERCDEWFILDPDFIEQCTGIKDKNGKLIYEGDILGYKDYADKRVVVWDNKYMAYRVHDEDNVDCGSVYQEYIGEFGIEVIGNIHENKELLNETDND